jgi:hypothetical protein
MSITLMRRMVSISNALWGIGALLGYALIMMAVIENLFFPAVTPCPVKQFLATPMGTPTLILLWGTTITLYLLSILAEIKLGRVQLAPVRAR